MKPTVEQIAHVCHEANRAYCETIGDLSQLPWADAPEWQRVSSKMGVEFHLHNLERGGEPSPSASHESWLAEKTMDGWKFGAVKDAEKKEHPCFVPYDQLPEEQKVKDYIFCAVVKAFYVAASGVVS